ncbi:MAG: SUMF1/EgtB/PvdO family nonheme iron enzyme [Chloroflexota bacterium]
MNNPIHLSKIYLVPQHLVVSLFTLTLLIFVAIFPPSTITAIAQSETPKAGTVRTDAKGIRQVYVPAGCFLRGSDPTVDKQALADEMPQSKVCITKGFWLDQFENSNTDYQQFIDAGGYKDRQWWSDDGWDWRVRLGRINPVNFNDFTAPTQPRAGITWYEAEAYTKWRGGRLPTEAEWEYAARGPADMIYPWGNTFDSTKLNYCDAPCPYAWADKQHSDGFLHSAPIDSYSNGVSWVGAYNMAGNAWEWVADWYQSAEYALKIQDDPTGPTTGPLKGLRGGAWWTAANVTRSASRHEDFPFKRFNNVTVRVLIPAQ